MAQVAAILGVANTLMSSKAQADAQRRGGEATRAAGNYAYQVNEINALGSEQAAADALASGNLEAERLGRDTRSLKGSQRAAFAGQGVDVNSGSALDVQQDASKQGEIDQATIRSNAYKEALGLRTQAQGYRTAGAQALQAGNNTADAMDQGAKDTLVTGGLQATAGYLDYYGRKRRPLSRG